MEINGAVYTKNQSDAQRKVLLALMGLTITEAEEVLYQAKQEIKNNQKINLNFKLNDRD